MSVRNLKKKKVQTRMYVWPEHMLHFIYTNYLLVSCNVINATANTDFHQMTSVQKSNMKPSSVFVFVFFSSFENRIYI